MAGFLTCVQEWRETDAVWSRLRWDGCAEGEIGGRSGHGAAAWRRWSEVFY